MTRRLLALMACLSAFSATPASIQAAGYPERIITLIVPVPPGGAGDFVGRLVAERLSSGLGEKVVVDNRGGAAGTIASVAVARSAGDGYTLLLSSSTTHGTAPVVYKHLAYDPIKSFSHIGLIASVPAVLSITAGLPVTSVAELVAYGKARPGFLNFGSSGNGGPNHLWGEMFASAAGISMTHVPYKGTGPAALDLVAGRIHVMLDGLPSQLSNINAGLIRPLAAMSPLRSPTLPAVPTMAESGYATVEGGLWFGLSGPAGLPPDIVEKLRSELEKLTNSVEFRERVAILGVVPSFAGPEPYASFIRAENQKYDAIVKAGNITIE